MRSHFFPNAFRRRGRSACFAGFALSSSVRGFLIPLARLRGCWLARRSPDTTAQWLLNSARVQSRRTIPPIVSKAYPQRCCSAACFAPPRPPHERRSCCRRRNISLGLLDCAWRRRVFGRGFGFRRRVGSASPVRLLQHDCRCLLFTRRQPPNVRVFRELAAASAAFARLHRARLRQVCAVASRLARRSPQPHARCFAQRPSLAAHRILPPASFGVRVARETPRFVLKAEPRVRSSSGNIHECFGSLAPIVVAGLMRSSF